MITVKMVKALLRDKKYFEKEMLKFKVSLSTFDSVLKICPPNRSAAIRQLIERHNTQRAEKLDAWSERIAKSKAIYDAIDTYFSKLDSASYIMVTSHYYDGLTYDKVAKKAFYSESGARKKIDAIIRNLIKFLNKECAYA